MKSLKGVENLINDLHDTTGADMDKRVLRDTMRALERSQEKSDASQDNIWKWTTKTQIWAAAAAAVIIIGILIGITIFSGPGEQTGREITQNQKVFSEKDTSQTAAKVKVDTEGRDDIKTAKKKPDTKLADVERMFRARDFDGLIAILSEGEPGSKIAAANYLARMGAIQALEPLQNASDEYGTNNRNNPFSRAIEIIKKRSAVADRSGTETKILKTDTAAADKEVTGTVAMNAQLREVNVDRSSGELGARSGGLIRSFQAEAREAADGYPIRAGGTSIAEVVPTSTYQNLVLYYSFHTNEDPNTAFDISGNNFHGLVHGAKYAQDETLGGTMSFDGDGDYISIPDVYLEGFTIAAWVKAPKSGSINNRRIFTLYDEEHCYAVEGNTGGGISVGAERKETDETTSTLEEYDTTTLEANDTELTGAEDSGQLSSESGWSQSNWAEGVQFSDYDWQLKPDTWTHITVTYDGETGRIYRNGKLTEEGYIPAEGFMGTAYIGGIDRHNGGFWQGMIDEVALFNQALSEEEVGQLYLMTGEMVATGPTLVEGVSGNGYYFDGEGDYINVGSISGLGAEQTKMLWIYMEASASTHEIYLIDEGGNNNWIELTDSDGKGGPKVRAGFDEENYFDSEGRIVQGYWCHIAVVGRASGDIDIYINGIPDSSGTGFSVTNAPQAIVIGTDSGTQTAGFKGIIDEVAIFNRALSDDEIKQVHQNLGRLSGNEAGLVGYWNFDSDDGDIVKDGSPYHNDGKLGGI
jgi:hypothetical protein